MKFRLRNFEKRLEKGLLSYPRRAEKFVEKLLDFLKNNETGNTPYLYKMREFPYQNEGFPL